MFFFVRETEDLVFDGRAVAGTAALDLARVEGRAMDILLDERVRSFIRERDVTGQLRLRDLLGLKTERGGVLVAVLRCELRKINALRVEARGSAGLKALDLEAQLLETTR